MILSKYIAGIYPLEPGFKTFAVRPHLCDLKEVSAKVATVSGEISVKARRSGPETVFDVTVPEGTKAEFFAPDGSDPIFGGRGLVLYSVQGVEKRWE